MKLTVGARYVRAQPVDLRFKSGDFCIHLDFIAIEPILTRSLKLESSG